jgi:hypothetical protein
VKSQDKHDELALMMLWVGGDLLVQERTHEEEHGLGFWGGKIKDGEHPFDAAVRETNEELYIPRFKPSRPTSKQRIEPIQVEGWLVHTFQALLDSADGTKALEGTSHVTSPMEMWHSPKLMAASRAVLREVILKPNGINDQGIRKVESIEVDNGIKHN